jgi:hypothetical protein
MELVEMMRRCLVMASQGVAWRSHMQFARKIRTVGTLVFLIASN